LVHFHVLHLICFTFGGVRPLSVASRRVVEVLERLPPRAPGKWIMCCYLTDDPGRDVCGMFSGSCMGSRVGII